MLEVQKLELAEPQTFFTLLAPHPFQSLLKKFFLSSKILEISSHFIRGLISFEERYSRAKT
jgi:hypothetical protein